MKRRVLQGALAVLLAACGTSSAHPAGATTASSSSGGTVGGGATACGPASAKTLASSSKARVYLARGLVYGCAHGAKHPYLLGQRASCLGGHARVAPVELSGALVAYGSQRCGVDTGASTIVVRRLSDGSTLSQQPATTTPSGPEAYVMVTALVIAGDGDVAWISTSHSIVAGHSATEVHALDRHGLKLLDHGAAINAAALRLAHTKVSWKHGIAWRSATLA
jgi:hypothetical protein